MRVPEVLLSKWDEDFVDQGLPSLDTWTQGPTSKPPITEAALRLALAHIPMTEVVPTVTLVGSEPSLVRLVFGIWMAMECTLFSAVVFTPGPNLLENDEVSALEGSKCQQVKYRT